MSEYSIRKFAEINRLPYEEAERILEPERAQARLAGGPFESAEQFLPPQLRQGQIGDILTSGVQGFGNLIQRPGGLSPTVSEAILPRLAMESQNIAQNFRGIESAQAGAAARGNLPLSLKAALQSALNVAQERAQRGARQGALAESEQLRRADLERVFKILDAILQFQTSGRGGAIQSRSLDIEQQTIDEQRRASQMAALASILGTAAVASASRFKEGFEEVSREDILGAVQSLPIYKWSYKGDNTRHIGPMAEDFLAAFGVGNTPDAIHMVDAVGTLMAATQALARKVERLETRR